MRIALVEDERKLAQTLKEGLEGEGYEVEVFHNGLLAEEGVLEDSAAFSAMILDLMLPRKNGFEVCESLRAQGVALPIIILTARDTLEDKVKALDSGADDFLTKPFEFEELMARLRAVARRTQTRSAGTPIVLDGLSVDRKTRQATCGKEVLSLTPTEFELLALLMENAGQPLSRDALSSHLWGIKDTSYSNIVDVHISNLRKKLSLYHAHPVIRTVRGRGYRI